MKPGIPHIAKTTKRKQIQHELCQDTLDYKQVAMCTPSEQCCFR